MAKRTLAAGIEEIDPDTLTEPTYLEVSKKVDAWTTVRKPVLLTPAICQVEDCGFDGIASYFKDVKLEQGERYAEWHELDDETHQAIRRLMERHKSEHGAERPKVFKESERLLQWPPVEDKAKKVIRR